MRLPKLSCAMLMLLALSACATPATPPIADSACLSFKRISYAIPPVQPDGSRNVAKDDGNQLDTPETVSEAQQHNARYDAVC
ncbi:hypothetical protein NT2_12_01640 [Caenibius tardaugens NBRC 16725]|uniref:Lipoprotein n=1 Tax=Caenibius tardaugens NBRC 16725 TaxID=1219035 RepID=U2YPQ9_9SPHN|nr:hypothetical protein NT2_12_01640 [Caenibius tardaugens NBRC 16725]